MKCPVCYTNIPVGKNECPNCGYETKTHKKTFNPYKPIDPKKTTYKVMNMFIVVMLCLTVFFIGRTLINELFFGDVYDSYEEALENIEDDGTIQKVINLQQPIIKSLSHHTYDHCTVNEKVEVKDNEIIVTTTIDSKHQHWCDIEVYIQAINNEIVHYTIQYGGFYGGQISRLKYPVDQIPVDQLMDTLNYFNAYEHYIECRDQMFNSSGILENTFIEKEYDHYNLVVNETYERAYDQTNYQLLYLIK